MSPQERQPLSDVLRGLEIHPLPKDWTALEALVLVKCLDEGGHTSWCFRTTHRLNTEEVLGAIDVHAEVLRRKLVSEWEHDED